MGPVNQLVGEQVEKDGGKQACSRPELAGRKLRERDGERPREDEHPHGGDFPSLLVVEAVPLGLDRVGFEAPALEPAIGRVGHPDSRGEDNPLGPVQAHAGRVRQEPLPRERDRGRVQGKHGRPLPPPHACRAPGAHDSGIPALSGGFQRPPRRVPQADPPGRAGAGSARRPVRSRYGRARGHSDNPRP